MSSFQHHKMLKFMTIVLNSINKEQTLCVIKDSSKGCDSRSLV